MISTRLFLAPCEKLAQRVVHSFGVWKSLYQVGLNDHDIRAFLISLKVLAAHPFAKITKVILRAEFIVVLSARGLSVLVVSFGGLR